MTFNEFTANTKESAPQSAASPTGLELLTIHLRTAKLIQDDEQKPLKIAAALHRQLSKSHEILMRESEADLNICRLSFQNLLLSYQTLLTIGLFAEVNGEAE